MCFWNTYKEFTGSQVSHFLTPIKIRSLFCISSDLVLGFFSTFFTYAVSFVFYLFVTQNYTYVVVRNDECLGILWCLFPTENYGQLRVGFVSLGVIYTTPTDLITRVKKWYDSIIIFANNNGTILPTKWYPSSTVFLSSTEETEYWDPNWYTKQNRLPDIICTTFVCELYTNAPTENPKTRRR